MYVFDAATGELLHTIGASSSSTTTTAGGRYGGDTIRLEAPRGLLLVRTPAARGGLVADASVGESEGESETYLVVAERRRVQLIWQASGAPDC